MLSGRKALAQIDQRLQEVRNNAVRLDRQLSGLAGQVTLAEQQRLAVLDQIAAVRLGELERGTLQATLNTVDQHVQDLLQQRTQAFDALNREIEQKNTTIAQTEQDRESQLTRHNKVSEDLLNVEAKVQAELKLKPRFIEQLNRAQQAESIAEEAEHKVEVATADLKEKAKPYQADPLFIYLWERGFGTTAYAAGLFARAIDGWVAKLINYEEARVNFWNLNEIPKRLLEHAERVGELADQEFETLQRQEREALERAGATEIEATMQELRAALDDTDDNIERLESELNALLLNRSEFDAGQDSYTVQCLDKIATALQHESINRIHQTVQETNSTVDDRLVLELQTIEDNLLSLNGDLASVRKLHTSQISKLRDLEGVRHQFKNSRFDDIRSGFKNESLINEVLSQFLQGVISGADLWGTIKRNQRYREQDVVPDFGSGGLGDLVDVIDSLGRSGVDLGDILSPRTPRRRQKRRSKGSTWHIPTPRKSGGSFKLPRSPKRSGGFKTGGGF